MLWVWSLENFGASFFSSKIGKGRVQLKPFNRAPFWILFYCTKTWCFFSVIFWRFFRLRVGWWLLHWSKHCSSAWYISDPRADGMIQRGVFPEIFPWLCLERYEATSSYGRTARGPCRETSGCSWNILAPVYCLYKSPWTPKTNKTVHRKNNSHSLLASFSLRFCRSYVFLDCGSSVKRLGLFLTRRLWVLAVLVVRSEVDSAVWKVHGYMDDVRDHLGSIWKSS